MALDKQKIALPIVDGLDTKGDDKTVLPTRFLELENVDFTNPGALQKRNGYVALSNKTLDGDDIETGSAITSLKDELLQYSDSRLYSYSEGEAAWEDKGEIRFCSAFSSQISADSATFKNPSFYSYGGVSCYAYEKEIVVVTTQPATGPDIYTIRNNVEIAIVDDVSNAILATHTLDGTFWSSALALATISAPKVGFVGSKFVVFYYISSNAQTGTDPTGLSYSLIDFLNPKVITHQITDASRTTLMSTTSNRAAKFKYDVLSFDSRCFVAYADGDTPDVFIRYIDSTLELSSATSTTYTADVYNISLNKQGSNLRVLISGLIGYTTYAYLFPFNLSYQVHPATAINPGAPADEGGSQYISFLDGTSGMYAISGYESQADSSVTYLVWQAKPIGSEAGYLQSGTIDSNGTFTFLANPLFAGGELQSKLVAQGGYIYFFVSKNVNSTYVSAGLAADIAAGEPTNTVNKPVRTIFLVKALGYNSEISAKFEVDTNVFVNASYMNGLPNVLVDGNKLKLATASINGLQPVNATIVLATSLIKLLTADFSQSLNYFDAAQGESLYISGGLLKQYDGNIVVEQGFLDTPEPIKEIAITGGVSTFGDFYNGAGLTTGEVYYYVVVYKWTDRSGKVHRSAPSRAVEVTVPAGGDAEKYVQLTFTPLYFTNKEGVEIELYRTTGNGTIYYKVSHVTDGGSGDDYMTGGYPNNRDVQAISVVDNVTDVELVFSEPLYTTGDILENDAPEASNYITTYKARLFLILSDGYTLQYSKVTGIGDPVRFNAAQKIPLDEFGGKATAIIAMDDHLIIFKERAIFALTGEGPNDLGEQDDYRTPYLITADAGCIDPNSIVNNPNGVMFKSAKGIYMLKRNFTLQYIGDSVEGFNDHTINSATLHPTLNQIRLITSEGIALVYDYYCNRWSTYTNIRGQDSISFGNSYYFIKSDGLVMRETIGSYMDNGQFIKMRIKSAWLQIGGVQGFERFYKMLLLGTYHSAHRLKVALAYNFNKFYQQSVQIDAGELLDQGVYGDDDLYGDGDVYGGEFPLYQFKIFPKIQKCQSFQFELSDSKTDIDGASFSLSHVVAEIGIKKGTTKKDSGSSFGAE